MSWFSLIQAEKSVLDSQAFFKNTLTGEFIGQYATDNILKKSHVYLRTRSAVSSFFSNKLSKPLDSVSCKISKKLLGRVIMRKDFPELFPELFDPFHSIAHEIQYKGFSTSHKSEKKEVVHGSGIHQLVHHIFDHYLASDHRAFKHWVKAAESGEQSLEKFVKKAVVASLMPACKKAVNISLKTFIQAGIESAFDNTFKTGISILSAAAIYSVAVRIFGYAAQVCKDSPLSRTFEFIKNRIPSSSMALWALTAFHTVEMVKIFWKVEHLHLKNTDLNKEQVKALALSLTKNSFKEALYETEVFKTLNFNEEKIDDFVNMLIRETIDFYWQDLHKIRFLNLPLVT